MGSGPGTPDSLAGVFADHGAGPYAVLARACADDTALAAAAEPLLPVLAALRRASFAGRAADPWTGDPDALRRDLVACAAEVADARADGLVQFTEPLRMTDLLPALLLAAARYPGLPVRLVEIGACAGLLLAPERYRIRYPTGTWATEHSTIDLASDLAVPPALLGQPLPVVDRVGIDLHPVHVTDDDAYDRLRSFAWPGDPRREARLAAAVAGLRTAPPPLVRGDAVTELPDVLDAWVGPGRLTVVVESAVVRYLDPRSVLALSRLLDRQGTRGPVVLASRAAARADSPGLPGVVRLVDLHRPARVDVARSDLLSERTAWIGPAG